MWRGLAGLEAYTANYTMRAYRSPETPINAVFKRAIVIHDCQHTLDLQICATAHALVDKLELGGQFEPLGQEKTVLLRPGKSYFPRRPW